MAYKIRVLLVLTTLLLVGYGILEAIEVDGNKEDISSIGYEIIEAKYINADIIIHYPQIINLGDKGKQNEINRILKEEALAVLDEYEESEISSKLSLDMDFDVMWDGQRLLSIRYLGDGYLKGAAHPFNFFYTTNINIMNGTKVRLKELIEIDDGLVYKLKQAKYRPWHSALNLAEDGILNEVLSDWFNDYNLIDYISKRDNSDEYLDFWYLTEDTLGISLGIPHAIGDHMEFEIDYKDLRSNIKAENELWKDFSINL